MIKLAARHRLPAVYTASYFVVAGGLMSYGIDQVDTFRLAAAYVTASYAVTSPPTCRCRPQPGMKWPSISKPRKSLT